MITSHETRQVLFEKHYVFTYKKVCITKSLVRSSWYNDYAGMIFKVRNFVNKEEFKEKFSSFNLDYTEEFVRQHYLVLKCESYDRLPFVLDQSLVIYVEDCKILM
jgi:hypothetical protein